MIKRINETLLELLLGIVAFGIAGQLIGMWFFESKLTYTIGLWIGVIMALLSAVHMYRALDRNLTINADNEKGAQAYAIRANTLRYFAIAIVFVGVCLVDFADPIGFFIGIMGLKIGAYLQPLTKKLYDKFIDKEVNV